MAFGQTRNQQLNQNIQRLLDYFLDQKLMKQRYGMMEEAETQRQAGYMGLEAEEHKNKILEATQKYTYDLSRDPEIDREKSLIFTMRRQGRDTKGLENELENLISTRHVPGLKASIELAQGKPLSDDQLREFSHLAHDTKNIALNEYGPAARQKEEIEKVEKPGLALREKEFGVAEKRVDLGWAELAQEKEKLSFEKKKVDKEEKNKMIALIEDVQNYLVGEGVKLLAASDIDELEAEFASSRGKILAPLSSENRGKSLTVLSMIRMKLIRNLPVTESELDFVNDTWNTWKTEGPAEAGGGLVLPQNYGRVSDLATPTTSPSITIPANARKAYNPTTGETAYWDGTRWIIIKNQ